jgi:hypothetical protein
MIINYYVLYKRNNCINQHEESEEYQEKLKRLKQRITELTQGRIKTYHIVSNNNETNGLDKFVDLLSNDLIEYFQTDWGKYAKLSEIERENLIHQNYAERKAIVFSARKETKEQMIIFQPAGNIFLFKAGTEQERLHLFLKSYLIYKVLERLLFRCFAVLQV